MQCPGAAPDEVGVRMSALRLVGALLSGTGARTAGPIEPLFRVLRSVANMDPAPAARALAETLLQAALGAE
jgi:hypothetical protein